MTRSLRKQQKQILHPRMTADTCDLDTQALQKAAGVIQHLKKKNTTQDMIGISRQTFQANVSDSYGLTHKRKPGREEARPQGNQTRK